jgi:hypothetical protein
MPIDYIKDLSDKHNIPVDKLETHWNNAKETIADKYSDDEKAKQYLKRVGEFNKRIEARAKQARVPNLPNLTGAKSLAELAVTLQPFVQTLKA